MPTAPVYVAGPLFDEGERWWIEKVDETVRNAGLPSFLPHRDNEAKTSCNVAQIFHTNVAAIDACELVVVSLNGVATDDGTAWEVGYAYARGKKIIGIYTDWRRRFDDEIVNLMLECSVNPLVRSLDELAAALAELDR